LREDFSFPSHDGRTRIHAIRWTPEDGKYHAILQITHGMIEHIERYEPFALYLTRHGFMVVGHDHLGHGSSVRSKEDWGYFAPENAGEILIEDMHRLRVITQEENPDLPYFMMGHSMGSFLLRKYIVVHGKDQPGDPEQAAELCILTTRGTLIDWCLHGQSYDVIQKIRTIIPVLLRGLLEDPGNE